MNIKTLISKLNSLTDEIKEKEIIIIAPNGLEIEPNIKLILKDKYDVLNHSSNNVEKMIITY